MDDAISVIAGTSTIHAETFAQALEGHVTTDPTAPVAFFVGIHPGLSPIVEDCQKKQIKTVAYWIGSDSLCALQQPTYRATIPNFDVHICVHERMQSELASWGVKSHVVWPCPRNLYLPQEITKKCVGCYQPTPYVPGDIYYFDQCVEIARQLPDLPFLFYGASYKALPKNVIDAGRMSPEECTDLYSQMSCMLRLTRHDGMPVALAEAKMKGLHFIQNYPYAGVLLAETIKSAIFHLQDDRTHQIDTSPWPQFFREQCSPQAFNRKIRKILDACA